MRRKRPRKGLARGHKFITRGKKFSALQASKLYPLVLLANVSWQINKALGGGKRNVGVSSRGKQFSISVEF